METGKIKLSIESDLAQVQHVGEAVRCLCGSLDLVDAKPSSVELAVVEAINNSIEHAYASQKGYTIEVSFEYNAEKLDISVNDCGLPMPDSVASLFKNTDVDMPSNEVSLESLPVSGWGLQLLKSVCDNVTYKRNSSGNTLMLSFKRASVAV